MLREQTFIHLIWVTLIKKELEKRSKEQGSEEAPQ